nr:hypothetical protein [Tanacetum cinerariifolium]
MIPNVVWDAITELCIFFHAICLRVLRIEDLEKLQKSIVEIICKLEKIFPPGFFDSMEHLVVHLVWEALLGGPVQYRWMYLYERKLGSLKRTVRNKARVEGSIVQNYLLNELSTYFSLYFDPRIETRLNREPQNFAPDIHCSSPTETRLNIFKVPSRRLFDSGTKRNLTNAKKHKPHTYILFNCEDVHPFFKDHIQSNGGNEHLKILARGPMHYVESHKGYFVNGYKFHTLKHGDGRVTHNNEVCVKGSTYNEFESDYYGLFVEVLEDLKDWWAVVKATSRSIYEVTQSSSEVVDDNVDVEEFFQENEMPTFNEAEEEFIDRYDDSDDKNELALFDHSSDEDEVNLSDHSSDENEVNLSDHSLNDYLLIIINWTRYARIMARDNNSKGGGRGRGRGKSGNGRGRGISGNIVIGSSSNVSGFGNQEDANCDNGSRSEGRGRGISRNIGIGGSSSNVSRFGNQEDANYDNGSISRERGRGRSANISGGSNVSKFCNQDADYYNGSTSGGRGRGISGNIGGRGSCSTSGFGNPDANFDTNDNETKTETSQRIRGLNLVQSIPNHPSQRPMITLYYGRMDEASEGRTREYVTASSKRVAMPLRLLLWRNMDQKLVSIHPMTLIYRRGYWGGGKKGKLVGLGTRGDQRVMVTCTAATSSSSSTSNEQVQTLEEIIRRLQEENTQIRSQNHRDMQIEIQKQVKQQVLEHM